MSALIIKKKILTRIAAAFLVYCVVTRVLYAQTSLQNNPAYEEGFKPYGSFQVGDIDAVDMVNGHLNLNIPIISYPQRGGKLHLGYYLSYSNMYLRGNPPVCGLPGMSTCLPGSVSSVGTGVNITNDFVSSYSPSSASGVGGVGNLVTPDGSGHVMLESPTYSRTVAADASGFVATPVSFGDSLACPGTTSRIVDRYGVTTTLTCQKSGSGAIGDTVTIADGNGNQMVQVNAPGQGYPSNWTDTMGRSIPVPVSGGVSSGNPNGEYQATTDTSGCTGSLPVLTALEWTVPGINGGNTQFKFCFATVYTQEPNACTAYGFGTPCVAADSIWMLESVVLPNGTAWTFEYDTLPSSTSTGTAYGDLIKIVTPEGGSISYTWGQLAVPCNSQNVSASGIHRAVTSRTVDGNDGTGPHVWTYTQANSSSCGNDYGDVPFTTTVTDPNLNDTVHTMTDIDAADNAGKFYETQVKYYQGTSTGRTLLQTKGTTYTFQSICDIYFVCDVLPQTVTTTWANGTSSHVNKFYDAGSPFAAGGHNTNGNVISEQIYDYTGSLIKTIQNDYLWLDNNNYLAANMIDLPSSSSIMDTSGSTVSSSTYTYDELAYLVASNITTEHSAPPNTVRGNLSTATTPISTGGSIATHTKWYDTGVPYKTYDGKGNTTTFAYSTTYIGAYPTTVTNALSQASLYVYDFNTGLKTLATDPNSNTIQYSYDNMGRLTEVDYPDTGQLKYCYNDLSNIACSGDSVAPSVLVSQKLSASAILQKAYDVDGLGRQLHERVLSDAQGTTTQDTVYDPLGHVSSVSNPYRTTSDSTYGKTSYTYDALGRILTKIAADGVSTQHFAYSGNVVTYTDESNNQWQRTSDVLGRLTKVFEPNGTGTAAVMQTDYVYDALDNLTTVNQWGGASGSSGVRSRTFSYDSLSRLILATNPESGPISYTYDANSNVHTRMDARGRTITYGYDVVNRLLLKTYSDSTLSSCFQYDTAALSGTHGNLIGRMTGEWTQTGACPTSAVTQIPAGAHTGQGVLAYDAMGRPKQELYSTPQSTNYSTSVSAGYDYAGHLVSLTYPDGRTVSQGFDSASRLNSVNYAAWNGAGTPTPYLTVNTYDAIGHPTATTFGNSITTAEAYNKRFELTSLSYPGTSPYLWKKQYTWTANGNLQTAADMVAGSTRQYAYDTLNRLTLAQDIAGTQSSTGESTDTSDGSDSNVLVDSQALGAFGWSANNASLTPNAVAAPDGTMTAGSIASTSGTDTWVTDYVYNPALYDGFNMSGSVWLRTPSPTPIDTAIYLIGVTNTGPGNTPQNNLIGPAAVHLTQSWQQFTVSGQVPNGLGNLMLQIGGAGTITAGMEVDVWGPQLQQVSTAPTVTNYLPYSETWNALSWQSASSTSVTVAASTSPVLTAPSGKTAGFQVSASSGSTDTYVIDLVSNPSQFNNQTVTGSVYLRVPSGTLDTNLYVNSGTGGFAILAQSAVHLTTTWQRFSLPASTTDNQGLLYIQIGGGGTVTSGKIFDVWGAQLEIASSAGQYVATLDSPVTVEADSTNILPSSEQLNGQGWAISNGTLTNNTTAVTAPDGTSTADAIVSSSTAAYLQDRASNPALYDGAQVTASVYLCVPSGTTLNNLKLDIIDGSSAGVAGLNAQLVTLTGTWQRFQVTGTNVNGLTALALQIGGSGSLPSGQTIYVWGAQMVMGSAAGAPIETANTTTSVTNGATVYLAANGLNQGFSYDAFGNMLQSGNFNFIQSYTTANQLSGWSYDASGNLLSDGLGHSFGYDAEGRISALNGNSNIYVYDAEGNRVSNAATSTDHIYFGGRELARLSGGQWTDLIYGVNGLLAEVPGTQSGAPVYRMLDHLGTEVGTLSSTGVLLSATDYAPFGQVFSGGSNDPYKFTGKERDAESGDDYFGARYYASAMGRFMSPDWSDKPHAIPYSDLSNPQSLNLYSYGRNNPLSNGDENGHCSAPSVGEGHVGICLEAYIQMARFGLFNMGHGDNRGPVANDPKATFRTQTMIDVNMESQSVTEHSTPGLSETSTGSRMGVVHDWIDDIQKGSDGSTTFTVHVYGENGYEAAHIPGAPGGWIEMVYTLKVTADGKVSVVGGSAKKFPSVSIYSYQSNGSISDVYQQKESGKIDDLNKKMSPVQEEAKRQCALGNPAACNH